MDTEDLVQEAFFGLFRRLPHLERQRRHALKAYLRQAIRNRVRDEIRRSKLVETSEVEYDPGIIDGESPFDAARRAEDAERYLRELHHLSEGDRELVVGRLELGYSYEQLALATGRRSADAARVAVRRAVLRLADRLESE